MRVYGATQRALAKIPFWKLRESAKSALQQLWRIRVMLERLYGTVMRGLAKLQLWRLRIWIERLLAQSWRLNVLGQRLLVEYAKLVGLTRRLLGWSYGRALEARTLWTTSLRPQLATILYKASYPIRKVYYFTSYQLKTRLGSNRKEPS
jgi:hypothetical protein